MDGQLPLRTLSRAQKEQARKAGDHKANANYAEAIKEYNKLIGALSSEARKDPERHIDILGLRCHNGSCLCERERLQTEDEASEAEAYVRATLVEWEKAEGEHCTEGIAFTKAELGKFLVWQAEQSDDKEEEFFISKGEEALCYLEEAWEFYRSTTGSPDDNLQEESILLNLSKAASILEFYEKLEKFSREGLERYGDLSQNAPYARKLDVLLLKLNLATSLLEQLNLQEAKKSYLDLVSWFDQHAMDDSRLPGRLQYCKERVEICDQMIQQEENSYARVEEVEVRVLDVRRRWRIATMAVQFAARLLVASRRSRPHGSNWRIVYCAAIFIVRHRRLKRSRTRRRWKRAIVASRVAARLVVAARKKKLCRINWRIVHYISMFIIWLKKLRKRRVQQRWRRTTLIVEAAARLAITGRKRRARQKCQNHWFFIYAVSVFGIRLRRLRRRQARQRWKEAVSRICISIRVQRTIKIFHERREITQQRWRKVLRLMKTIGRFKLRLIRKVQQRKRRWTLVLSYVTQRAHNKIQNQERRMGMWRAAITHARLRTDWFRLVHYAVCAVRLRMRVRIKRKESTDIMHMVDQVPPIIPSRQIFFGTRFPRKFQSLNEEDREQSDIWLESYANFCEHLAKYSKATSTTNPVKIAIIDSGIDINNSFIAQRWPPLGRTKEELDEMGENAKVALREKLIDKRYKDFLDGPSGPEDKDGHGTHIAGLILRYASNAHLYVARITETTSSCRSDVKFEERIVKAIEHALMVWKVDIVSLSFAMRGTGLQQKIDDLIDQAHTGRFERNRRMRTIILAAACNEGGREPVPYPANHTRVFSIRALTGYNKDADFSAFTDNCDANFSILGTHVLSTWPTQLYNPKTVGSQDIDGPEIREFGEEGRKVKCVTHYMNGTSFAAPLAAALLANVFAYHREHKKDIAPDPSMEDDYTFQLQRFESVMKLLKAMSLVAGVAHILTPWRQGSNFMMTPRARSIQELNIAIRVALEAS